MSEIKIGDKVEVINSSIFGYAVHTGYIGVVKKITDGYEVEIYFDSIGDGLTQWVHYPTWEKWVKVVKE